MKIQTFGAKHFTGQLPRIEEAFRKLGHEITENRDEAHFIYANNAPYYDAFSKNHPDLVMFAAPTICNVLDIPEHLPNVLEIIDQYKKQLALANAVTCISNSVKEQIRKHVGIEATVIYNPIKDVKANEGPLNKTLPFLYVGRANDQNKRFQLARQTVEKLGLGQESLIVVGSENPGWGYYLGLVPDEVLNSIYNYSKYVFLPSKFEGIGLPMIEAMVCKSIPILCEDNPTAKEFAPEEYISAPNPTALAEKIRWLDTQYETLVEQTYETKGKQYLKQFSKEEVAQNILNVYAKL